MPQPLHNPFDRILQQIQGAFSRYGISRSQITLGKIRFAAIAISAIYAAICLVFAAQFITRSNQIAAFTARDEQSIAVAQADQRLIAHIDQLTAQREAAVHRACSSVPILLDALTLTKIPLQTSSGQLPQPQNLPPVEEIGITLNGSFNRILRLLYDVDRRAPGTFFSLQSMQRNGHHIKASLTLARMVCQ